jgi:tetratricopeptide (TPR) repeat protein
MAQGETPQGSRNGWKSLGLVQREILLVGVLSVVAVLMFGVTENLADWTVRTATAQSAAWFERGRNHLLAGRKAEGLEALRNAVAGDRLNTVYTLALARALIDDSRASVDVEPEQVRAEAKQLLSGLREREPDVAEVNLYLAQLAVEEGAAGYVAEATRYYNHAMYGLEPEDPQFDRHLIRVELINFLLTEGDRAAALAELIALAREVPNQLPARLEVADLFLRAAEPQQALAQYSVAMAIDQTSRVAAVGAGRASFDLAQFRQAEQHLEFALALGGADDEDVARLLETTRLVQASDPEAPGLATAERVRRLRDGLDWAAARLEGCVMPSAPSTDEGVAVEQDEPSEILEDPLVAELRAFAEQPAAILREANTLVEGIDLIVRGLAGIDSRCQAQEPDLLDDAWRAIERARSGRR